MFRNDFFFFLSRKFVSTKQAESDSESVWRRVSCYLVIAQETTTCTVDTLHAEIITTQSRGRSCSRWSRSLCRHFDRRVCHTSVPVTRRRSWKSFFTHLVWAACLPPRLSQHATRLSPSQCFGYLHFEMPSQIHGPGVPRSLRSATMSRPREGSPPHRRQSVMHTRSRLPRRSPWAETPSLATLPPQGRQAEEVRCSPQLPSGPTDSRKQPVGFVSTSAERPNAVWHFRWLAQWHSHCWLYFTKASHCSMRTHFAKATSSYIFLFHSFLSRSWTGLAWTAHFVSCARLQERRFSRSCGEHSWRSWPKPTKPCPHRAPQDRIAFRPFAYPLPYADLIRIRTKPRARLDINAKVNDEVVNDHRAEAFFFVKPQQQTA